MNEGFILAGNNGVICSRRYDFVGVLDVEMSINIRVVVGEIMYSRTGPIRDV